MSEKPARLRITPPSGWFESPLGELWSYRELLYFFVWRDIKIRYKQTAIGAAWAVLQPFLTMLVFSLFFGKLAHVPSDGLPYPIFYYSALLPWMYFAAALQTATNAIVDNQRVITKVYFPRVALPLAAVLAGLVDFAHFVRDVPGADGLLRHTADAGDCLVSAVSAVGGATALGVGLWLSALNAIYRDVRYVVPFLIQFWMFASPVAYPSSLVPAKWRWLYGLNPMAGVIEGFRWSLTGRGDPPGMMLGASVARGDFACGRGLAYFQRMEATVADVV